MRLADSLAHVATLPQPEDFSKFEKDLPRDWIEEALLATGRATLRRRRLPAEQVVWLVVGMALFRNRPIQEVVAKLNLALPDPGRPTVAPAAIVKARERIGAEPLAWLFLRCADAWARPSGDRDRWRGLALYGVDGTTLRVSDTEDNRAFFRSADGGPRGTSGYPLVRLVALMALRSHILVNAAFGPYDTGEHGYARELWSDVPDHSLTVLDRGFWAANVLIPLAREGRERHWLIRAKEPTKGRRIQRLGELDDLVELKVSPQARAQDPSLPQTWLVRIVHYQRKGFRPQRLITSLLDAVKYPAEEIVALYHERWELELAYDEVKTHVLESIPLRSKSPARVRQEIWGLLIAYNLIRLEIERVADEAKVKPTRISFVAVYRMICDEWLWSAIASPGAIPRHLLDLREQVKRFVLPERRSDRHYPRAVKIKMSNYARKRPVTDGGAS